MLSSHFWRVLSFESDQRSSGKKRWIE